MDGESFRASWRSKNGLKLLSLLVMAGALAFQSWRTASLLPLVAMVVAVGMAWWMGQEFRAGHALLRIDGEGVGGYWVYGKTLRWADVQSVHAETVLRMGPLLVLGLRPGSPSLRLPVRSLVARQGVRLIPLSALSPSDRQRAEAAAQQAWAGAHRETP